MLKQLMSALKHLHSLGIAHRGISDSNVMVSGDGPGEYRYKLIDFDLSFRVIIPEPVDQPWTVTKPLKHTELLTSDAVWLTTLRATCMHWEFSFTQ